MPRKKPHSFVIRPNVGLRMDYQRRINRELALMQASLEYWIRARYREHLPRIVAQDARPANDLAAEMNDLGRQWLKRFDRLSDSLARYFAKKVADRTDGALTSALRRGGMTVRLQFTRAQADAVAGIVQENVSLIRSIAQQHLTAVEGAVMRSVIAGRDLEILNKELRERFGVTKRRAALIARDQNNKATAMLHRVRQQELGLKATWLHSAGGKTPRPSHVRESGKEYDPATGWYDPDAGEFIWPGTLINCRCVSKSVVPGFS